ncbi:hypothetical protein K438DRAFT_1853485 [Mycena galopus ATCC 62051]|nr:hypothetical protein K438DRAFT_1853485 [Mycena galopus ATCC 62051]
MEVETEADGGGGEAQMEPPQTPLLHASPAPARIVHVHHHHHHHHYAPAARSVSVPPGESTEDGLSLGMPLGLMSAPATPALGAAATLAPPSAFTLDPTLLGLPLPHRGNMNAANTLHATLMGPNAHGHGEAMYDLPFLDLHYFGGGAPGAQQMQMQLEGWRGGEALDLARSASAATTAGAAQQAQSFAPSAFSFAQGQPRTPQPQTVSVSQAQAQAQAAGAPPPGVWKALGIPASLRQHIPPRPLMRRASAGPPGVAGMRAMAAASTGGNGHARSASHHRGQSAVVRPQDLVLSPEHDTAPAAGPKGKRKRASWDGGGW